MGGSEATKLGDSQERAVMAELARLLESSAFRTSKRCREFLEYIVVHTISGPSSALKERSIGIELFQLPQDFDLRGQREHFVLIRVHLVLHGLFGVVFVAREELHQGQVSGLDAASFLQ